MTEENTTPIKVTPAKPAAVRKATAAKQALARKEKKPKKSKATSKVKVVRDSFTMPQGEYAKISELKQVCLKAGFHVKKSELLRAGLHVLSKLSAAQLKQTIARMEQIKTGRPKKGA